MKLEWDMRFSEGFEKLDPKKIYGVVTTVNTGRRPVYVTKAFLEVRTNTGSKHYLFLVSSAWGEFSPKRLAEGDPPAFISVEQEQMKEYAKHWKKIRAIVHDAAGKQYRSSKVSKCPSWAAP